MNYSNFKELLDEGYYLPLPTQSTVRKKDLPRLIPKKPSIKLSIEKRFNENRKD